MGYSIDLNADLGEGNRELDRSIMPYLSSCNVACGGHAGDEKSMNYAIELAVESGVQVGAHPSFPDQMNFGREIMNISKSDLVESLIEQIETLNNLAAQRGVQLNHVKPHGALYNLAATDLETAELIAETMAQIDPKLKLVGLAGSQMADLARQLDVPFVPEAFADRKYEADGTLRSRKYPDAVLTDVGSVLRHVRGIIVEKQVDQVPIVAQSICLHSDTPGAVNLARQIHRYLIEQGITIHSV